MITEMLYSALLIVHIAGGVATGIAASYAGIVLWRGTSSLYRACALTLSVLAVFEILSGVALSVVSVQITAQSLCSNIALYLSALLFIEALLFVRMKKVSMRFPLVRALSPILASLVLLIAAVSFGF